MQHVTFALFRQHREARDALRQLAFTFSLRNRIRILIRSAKTPSSELEMDETHASKALLRGTMLGAAGGILAGIVSALAGLRWFHFDMSTIVFAVIAGFVIGGFSGFLFGSINPHPALQRLEDMAKNGGVVITVESESERATREAEQILRAHHGYLKEAT